MRIAIAVVACALAGRVAHADQCAYLDHGTALRAQRLLELHPTFSAFCERCGDKAPSAPVVARTVVLGSPSPRFFDIAIDGNEVDLAYTYVQISDGEFANLAALAGCPTEDVSPTLHIETTSPTAVVIRAADAPAAEPALPPAVAPAEPAPPQVVYVVRDAPTPWWVTVSLAGGMAAVAFGAAALVRRRRTHVPRYWRA